MTDKVVPLRGGKFPATVPSGSVAGLLERVLADLKSGEMAANKAMVLLLDDGPVDAYNVRVVAFDMDYPAQIGLLEAIKSMLLKRMGF